MAGQPPRVGAEGVDPQERGVSAPLHFQDIAHWGACGKTPVVPHNRWPGPEPTERGRELRVLLPTYGARGDAGPPTGLAVRSREPGTELMTWTR
jgi:hypothetical protein